MDKMDEKSFINNFTIRLKEFHLVIDNLLKQKKKPLQHFLITGKRGMGKSTLLRRIHIEASRPPLSEKLVAVRLGTEQYRLSRLFKLWEMVIEQLGNNDPVLLAQKKDLEKSSHYENALLPIINDYLKKTDKTLLLLIDNFDQFIDKIPFKDQHAFREALMLYPIQVIGNTVFYNEHFKSYNEPFFDFFKPIHLTNLDKEESEEFIRLRAASEGIENFEEILKKQKGKINALRILSGGVPRTLLILLSIVSKRNTGDAVDYLNEMLEQVTPLYQDRMKALSPQQQEIMHHLAMRWDRTPVKELGDEMRIPTKSISAQLIQLENSGYVKKTNALGRILFYEIDERFFNIWLLMSEAASYDTKRVIWLTKWLDAFYNAQELEAFAVFFRKMPKTVKPENRFLIAQAVSESTKLAYEHKRRFINDVAEDLKDKIPDVKTWSEASNKKLTEELQNKERDYKIAADNGNVDAMLSLAQLYQDDKKDIAQAEKYYQIAADKGDTNAVNMLGLLYEIEKKDFTGAEKYYLIAANQGNTGAMFNLGVLYQYGKNDIENAEKYYQLLLRRDDTDAMVALALLYQYAKEDIKSAEKYYQMAAHKENAVAMSFLADLYFGINNTSKKAYAKDLSGKAIEATHDIFFQMIHAKILLWTENIKDARHLMTGLINSPQYAEGNMSTISITLQHFLIFRQTQFLHQLFTAEPELIDRYKPVYFALMHQMQNEHPKEYLKMPPELEEPVKAILDFVTREQKRLGV